MRWRWAATGAMAVALAVLAPMASATPAPSFPQPSPQVVAFYYGWYGNPTFDGQWVHWGDDVNRTKPPDDISSDYYPELGAYSSRDPAVLRQHMAWLKRAKVGVIALSWWAEETSDAYVRQVLDAAKSAGIKVTLHIEPATGRTSRTYQSDVIRLVKKFGSHPAFFTTPLGSPHVKGGKPRALIFVWATAVKDLSKREIVEPSYWAAANDAIHRKSGALVLACPCGGGYDTAVTQGHFDGAYNYATLHLEKEGGFDWARSLPPGAIYVPSVMPGNHADRIGYPKDTIVPRLDGATYDEQWSAALGTGVTPDLVSITSFNEWHEGSQIEPTRADYSTGGRNYLDFAPLSPTSYLDRTAIWAGRYASGDYPHPASTQVRLRVTTTSDWLAISIDNGALARPGQPTLSPGASDGSFNGALVTLNQPLARAQQELSVSLTVEALALGDSLTFVGTGGHIGQTTLTIEVRTGTKWTPVGEARWAGAPDDGASRIIALT